MVHVVTLSSLTHLIESLSLSSGTCRTHAQEQLDVWLNSSITLLRDTYETKSREIEQLFGTLTNNLDQYKQRQSMTLTKQNKDMLLEEVQQLQRHLPTLINVRID
jgi:hypothetical protein